MIVSISQSNYIPWKGYFDMIDQSDVFVLYDDMQYTKRDWRNRNKIKTASGLQWLTVPVNAKGKFHQKINETTISEPNWSNKHLRAIELAYGRAEHFETMFPLIKSWYVEAGEMEFLSDVNRFFLEGICKILRIDTKLVSSSEFEIRGTKTDALISVLDQIKGARTYLSGPAAKDYLDIKPFDERHIKVKWMDYSAYPKYEQLNGEFEHGVSILDLLLNQGAEIDLIRKK